MRHLISTLQNHNQQMKGEVVKFKLRLRETQAELNQVNLRQQQQQQQQQMHTPPPSQTRRKGGRVSGHPFPRPPGCSVGVGGDSPAAWLRLQQVRTAKGSGAPQSQSSAEVDVKEETVSPPAAVGAAVKTEPDNGAATPSNTGKPGATADPNRTFSIWFENSPFPHLSQVQNNNKITTEVYASQ